VNGVSDAFSQNIVRIVTPVHLLLQGQQTQTPYISLLLWTIAIDALLAAASEEAFTARLQSFLGADEYVFPENWLGFQPDFKVGEVAKDIYILRNILAHGNRIPEKFWKDDVGFRVADRRHNTKLSPWPNWSYAQVLSECSLFLLCGTLKKILLTPTLMHIVGTKNWETFLKACTR